MCMKMSLKNTRVRARQLAQWVRTVALQAWGPEFWSQDPYKKSDVATCANNPSAVGDEAGGLLELVDH